MVVVMIGFTQNHTSDPVMYPEAVYAKLLVDPRVTEILMIIIQKLGYLGD